MMKHLTDHKIITCMIVMNHVPPIVTITVKAMIGITAAMIEVTHAIIETIIMIEVAPALVITATAAMIEVFLALAITAETLAVTGAKDLSLSTAAMIDTTQTSAAIADLLNAINLTITTVIDLSLTMTIKIGSHHQIDNARPSADATPPRTKRCLIGALAQTKIREPIIITLDLFPPMSSRR